ncbi:Pentatricopeptide repeat-containing protein 2, mitochondrial [Pseudocercospora fuligena]|uniref:Pentatricopeptide repeat-containing protein 2, mitochondrial n=1 Tax=Pseudocercospora fuligena TaxID=685502 RepID=A0A8H6RUH8_9PEZI|nr:Pentatricopeptide repeat-containing protein 2, mitochondrial [Pseudocercospora fuligena]
MLECRACVLRSIRAIAGDAYGSISTSILQRPLVLTPQLANRPAPRRLATAAAESNAVEQDALSSLEPVPQPTTDIIRSKRRGPITVSNEKALRKELIHLKDRVKFADHVHYILRDNKPEKALDLCRLGSREMQCTVAWNHVIAWNLENGKVKQALEIYNEMKKRAQWPDSYTYMRLFQGLMDKPEHVGKAVAIYNSMSSPTSKVKPSVMHTNAVLRICALALDMDALWGIVANLPEAGPNAADTTTYTTILQSIRHAAMGDEQDPQLMESQRQEAVNEGRRIWQEVIQKWRGGDLIIDEALVTAMANLLLISRRLQDTDDVLSLVQQTTNLERLIAPVGSPDRKLQHLPRDRFALDPEEEDTHPPARQDHFVPDPEGFVPSPSASAFKPVTPLVRDSSRPKRSTSLAWVKPGNGILSALFRACRIMRIPKVAYAYWDTITAPPYGLEPDLSNFKEVLRMYRINRAADKAVSTVAKAHNEYGVRPMPGTYQLAMAVCARDHKNRRIVATASRIIDDMLEHLEQPDIVTLEQYLSLALATSDGPQIALALEHLMPVAGRMQELAGSKRNYRRDAMDETDLKERRQRVDDKQNAMDLYKDMIGAIDVLKRRELIPERHQEFWTQQRARLDSDLAKTKWDLKDRKHRNYEIRERTKQKKDLYDAVQTARAAVQKDKEVQRLHRKEQETRRSNRERSGVDQNLRKLNEKGRPWSGLIRRHTSDDTSEYAEQKRSARLKPKELEGVED